MWAYSVQMHSSRAFCGCWLEVCPLSEAIVEKCRDTLGDVVLLADEKVV